MLRIYQTSLSMLRGLKNVVDAIERRDRDLARQLRRAASSVTLNIAEGSYARGGNRQSLYNVALGSAKETRACIDVAMMLGYVTSFDAQIDSDLNSICAVLYRLIS
jgi:four helix bundle protein